MLEGGITESIKLSEKNVQRTITLGSRIEGQSEEEGTNFKTNGDKMVPVSTPYLVELPEEVDESAGETEFSRVHNEICSPAKMVNRIMQPNLLQITYENVLVEKFERVNLKRAAEEDWEDQTVKLSKKGKVELGIETVLLTGEKKQREKGKRNSPKRKKKGRGMRRQSNLSLVEVPVRQITNEEWQAEGCGGLPLQTTKES